MTKTTELSIFNRKVGTCTGWDDIDHLHLVFYDFKPYEGFDMPQADLSVDYENGFFMNFNDDGDIIVQKDFLTVMNGFVARQTRL